MGWKEDLSITTCAHVFHTACLQEVVKKFGTCPATRHVMPVFQPSASAVSRLTWYVVPVMLQSTLCQNEAVVLLLSIRNAATSWERATSPALPKNSKHLVLGEAALSGFGRFRREAVRTGSIEVQDATCFKMMPTDAAWLLFSGRYVQAANCAAARKSPRNRCVGRQSEQCVHGELPPVVTA